MNVFCILPGRINQFTQQIAKWKQINQLIRDRISDMFSIDQVQVVSWVVFDIKATYSVSLQEWTSK